MDQDYMSNLPYDEIGGAIRKVENAVRLIVQAGQYREWLIENKDPSNPEIATVTNHIFASLNGLSIIVNEARSLQPARSHGHP